MLSGDSQLLGDRRAADLIVLEYAARVADREPRDPLARFVAHPNGVVACMRHAGHQQRSDEQAFEDVVRVHDAKFRRKRRGTLGGYCQLFGCSCYVENAT